MPHTRQENGLKYHFITAVPRGDATETPDGVHFTEAGNNHDYKGGVIRKPEVVVDMPRVASSFLKDADNDKDISVPRVGTMRIGAIRIGGITPGEALELHALLNRSATDARAGEGGQLSYYKTTPLIDALRIVPPQQQVTNPPVSGDAEAQVAKAGEGGEPSAEEIDDLQALIADAQKLMPKSLNEVRDIFQRMPILPVSREAYEFSTKHKPGQGGQLPGFKVTPLIEALRIEAPEQQVTNLLKPGELMELRIDYEPEELEAISDDDEIVGIWVPAGEPNSPAH